MFLKGLLLSFLVSSSAYATYDFEVKLNGSNELFTQAKEKFTLDMSFTHQETGKKPHHYMKMHDKLMHMILVSDDLEHFAHVHPSFKHMASKFSIDLNVEMAPDPDNLDTVNTIANGGRYFSFTEVMPHDDEMMMVYSRFQITATGEARKPAKKINPITGPGQKAIKYFNTKGRESKFGAKYKMSFDFEQHQWCSWYLPKFYVLIEVWDQESKSYKEPSGLQRWLGMGGHAVLISRNQLLEQVSFYHLHALLPVTTPGEFVFPYHDHKKGMDDGNYRMFMQFKHDDKVQKVFFDFNYTNPPLPESVLSSFLFC